jgi:hypothetical protein
MARGAYSRCHVIRNGVRGDDSTKTPTQKCAVTPRAEFVCFVDYTATSAHSVLNVRDNFWRQQVSPCKGCAHTSTKKCILRLVSCPPNPRIQQLSANTHPRIQTHLTTPHNEITFPSLPPSPVAARSLPDYPPPSPSTRTQPCSAARTRLSTTIFSQQAPPRHGAVW